ASGGGNYLWNTSQTSASISISPGTTTNYSVVVSIGSCTATATYAVTVNPNPTASISGNNQLCQGTSTTLTASGGGTYLWNTGNTTAAVAAAPGSTTAYTVT